MRSPDQLRAVRCADKRFQIGEKQPDWRFNRDLYFAIGWRWIDKRSWAEAHWKECATAPELRTFGAYHGDSLAGYYELRRDSEAGIEIACFGLFSDSLGRGFGGALLTSAIEEAWRMSDSIARVWVHTCTSDNPHALANYLARGMAIYMLQGE